MQSSDVREIARGTLAGSLLWLLGNRFWGLRLTEGGIVLLARRPTAIAFTALGGPPRVERRLGFSAVVLPLIDGAELNVAGLKRTDATTFAEVANALWRRSVRDLFAANDEELRALAEVFERLSQPRRYPSACLLEPYAKRAKALVERLPKTVPEATLTAEQRQMLEVVAAFQKAPAAARASAIETFVAAELEEMPSFFETIEANPLTPEQRLAVVTDEDATLVLAGAGSGKTSVIVAKAAYLIQRGIRRPEEILLLAFGKRAADEMASRIKARCGTPVEVRTFHALGYEIIRAVEGQAPPLAAHASDEAQFRVVLRDILINDVAQQDGLGVELLQWFSAFSTPYKSQWDFTSLDAYYRYVEANELRTLQGERVRSFEELEIANWLYCNGIAYEYEPVYEHELPENDRRAYTPDFRLAESGVYIEHFGVRKGKGPDGKSRLTTASYVDREKYLEGMEWKRKVHKDYGTTLIETYSYERVEGRLTEALAEKLAPYAKAEPIPAEQIFEILKTTGRIDEFTQTLATFLRHFKGAGLTLEDCRKRAGDFADSARQLAFLGIFETVLEAYQARLEGRIDFEDMIGRATEHVRSGRYRSPYRHIVVDEFQDISGGRAKLLLALKEQHRDARLFAVGDDWQSIYRFAGSDIHLMRHFGGIFGGGFAETSGVHSTIDLGRTFRSVDEIARPARRFILKNPAQIRKQVIPAGTAGAPAIKVAYSTAGQESAAVRVALDDIQATGTRDGNASVLLLGRYHFVAPDNLAGLASAYPDLSLRFMTVHASKGLEADHVVILRTTSGRMGFPSEIVDDPLLHMVLPEAETFDHAEERRLFYVALTRARKSVTILADRMTPSVFARELVDESDYGAIELGKSGVAERRCGACGGRMLSQISKAGRVRFACEHRDLCGQMLRPCRLCKNDLPVKDSANPETLICRCGARFPACPDCNDGWLVERKGRYGKFLGCVKYPSCKGSKQLGAAPNRRHS